MLFNSFTFGIFLAALFIIYWSPLKQSLRFQNFFLLAASYFFYGWWDWRFLTLIAISSLVDYLVGLGMLRFKTDRVRGLLLGISLTVNLGMLGFFKYFNFFVDSAAEMLQILGVGGNVSSLSIILPVGISFYTFQTLSYTIDLYRRKVEPTTDPIAFFAFVSFFPQLVAGPIERAGDLLPQFLSPRRFDSALARSGLRLMLWGLFKKVVIADNLAPIVDQIFANYETLSAPQLILGTIFFAFQIYCDFSGYSEIAVGTARLIGFNLTQNFHYPYLSRNVGEFWRRWHITLSSWFRDYLYIPLGGSRTATRLQHFRNLLLTFTLSGLWHGANWTFVIWGLLHGLYYLPLVWAGRNRTFRDEIAAKGKWLPSSREMASIMTTFLFVSIAWVFFRAESLAHALNFLTRIISPVAWYLESFRSVELAGMIMICGLMGLEWIQREKHYPLDIEGLPVSIRWGLYYGLIFVMLYYRADASASFIYFQF